MFQPSALIDGFRLIRKIGAGGFGEVWLCQAEASEHVPSGEFMAMKFVPATDGRCLAKEFHGLAKFIEASEQLSDAFLVPIVYANLCDEGLYYVMPLSVGYGSRDPEDPTDPDWMPVTLSALIEFQRSSPSWFTSDDIKNCVLPILLSLQSLSDASLIHRDVKPDNILLFGVYPCLADISLLGPDKETITRRGTPGYSAPSWYVESGGHPDMYGVAVTLYTLLTGNQPDKMGRAAFRWPPQGEESLSDADREEWLRLHRVIRRAIDDRPAERFHDFSTFARALTASHGEALPAVAEGTVTKSRIVTTRPSPPSTGNGLKTDPDLVSEIPWVSYGRVLSMLEHHGFKLIKDDPTLYAFRREIYPNEELLGVGAGMHISPARKSIWSFGCVRISTKETMEADDYSFMAALMAICGSFVSEKEGDQIFEFIFGARRLATKDRPAQDSMWFDGAFLKTWCDITEGENGILRVQHSFHLSSKE